jgi:hypothetical protein
MGESAAEWARKVIVLRVGVAVVNTSDVVATCGRDSHNTVRELLTGSTHCASGPSRGMASASSNPGVPILQTPR